MPALDNDKHELFATYWVNRSRKEAYIEAGLNTGKKKYANQNAYSFCKTHPEIEVRRNELKNLEKHDGNYLLADYLEVLDSITFSTGIHSGDNRANDDKILSACTKAMKARGFEGATDLTVSGGGGFQIVMHSKPQEEKEGDKEDGESKD